MRCYLPGLLLSFLLAPHAATACECLWQGDFATVQAETDFVVSGTVTDTSGNSIDLRVDRALRGGRGRDTVRVWLRTADYCRPEVDRFPVGTQWVMALHEITEDVPGGFNPHTPNTSYGRVGDYWLSNCGGFWLSRKGEWATGNLIDAPRWVREPEMTPVLIDLVEDFVNQCTGREALRQAASEDPALRELMLDTRAFMRGDPVD